MYLPPMQILDIFHCLCSEGSLSCTRDDLTSVISHPCLTPTPKVYSSRLSYQKEYPGYRTGLWPPCDQMLSATV